MSETLIVLPLSESIRVPEGCSSTSGGSRGGGRTYGPIFSQFSETLITFFMLASPAGGLAPLLGKSWIRPRVVIFILSETRNLSYNFTIYVSLNEKASG